MSFSPGIRTSQAGFTLAELLIATTISTIMILGVALFMGSLGRQSARIQKEQEFILNIQGALEILRRDVAQMGAGVPWGLLGQNPAQLSFPDMVDWIARYTFTNANNSPVVNAWGGSPSNRMNGTDEIWLGGIGMDLHPSSQKATLAFVQGLGGSAFSPQSSFLVASNDLAGAYWDGYGGYHSPGSLELEGRTPLGMPGDQVTLLDPERGWLSCAGPGGPFNPNIPQPFGTFNSNPALCGPILIGTVTPAMPAGALGVVIDSTSTRTFWASAGTPRTLAVATRSLSSSSNPIAVLQSAHWYLRNDGTLIRRTLTNPSVPCDPIQCPELPVLTGVRDFQISYLIWPCGGSQPIWVSDLIYSRTAGGEFGYIANPSNNLGTNYPYGSLLGIMRRMMILRERLIAIRFSLLIEVPGPRPEGYTTPPSLLVEDHLNTGLNPRSSYVLVQEVMDPLNFRLKPGARSYIPIRSTTDDRATFTGSTCDALCVGQICPQ